MDTVARHGRPEAAGADPADPKEAVAETADESLRFADNPAGNVEPGCRGGVD